MFSRKVAAPDGASWTIRRHWVAGRPKFRRLFRLKVSDDWEPPAWLDLFGFAEEGLPFILAAFVGLAILIFLVIPALIFLVELLLFMAVASLLVFVNSLFRRPWIVEAVRDQPDPQVMRWRVTGLLRSRRVIAEIDQALRQGHRYIQPLEAERLEEPSP